MTLQARDAKQLIELCEQHAAQYKKPFSTAVVDAGGYLIALLRQDGSRAIMPSIAISKAYTAAVMGRPANTLKPWAENEPAFFGRVQSMGLYPIVPAEGGITIKRNSEILGGLGVSGGRPEEDHAVCEYALSVAGYDLKFETWGQKTN